jgi:MFS family permease
MRMADAEGGATDSVARSAAQEWKSGWPVVVASSLGMTMLGVGYLASGTFIQPLEQEFHWDRAQISIGFTVFAGACTVLQPLVGMLLDRWGARRLALPGAALTGLAVALFSTFNGSMAYWLALWLLLAIAFQGVQSPIWAVAISSHFVANRGRAFGVTMAGSGLAAALPWLSNYIIEHQGWRAAYLEIGIGWGGLVWLVSYFMLHQRRDRSQARAAAAVPPTEPTGYTIREGLVSGAFIKMFLAILISNLIYFAFSFHLLPILMWAGLPRNTAVIIQSSLGVTMILGTILYALIADRISPRIFTALLVALPAITLAMLLYPTTSALQRFIAVGAFGISCGAQLPSFTNLSMRYLGMRSFGALSGLSGIASQVATAVAPFIAAVVWDHTKSYALLLEVGVPALIVSGLILLALDRRPQFELVAV